MAEAFATACPVDIPEGRTIYRIIQDGGGASGGHWSCGPPSSKAAWRAGYAVLES